MKREVPGNVIFCQRHHFTLFNHPVWLKIHNHFHCTHLEMSFWWCKTWVSGGRKGLAEAAGSENVLAKTVGRIQGYSWCAVCRNSPARKSKHCHEAICRLSGVSQQALLCLTLLWCLPMPLCSIPAMHQQGNMNVEQLQSFAYLIPWLFHLALSHWETCCRL